MIDRPNELTRTYVHPTERAAPGRRIRPYVVN